MFWYVWSNARANRLELAKHIFASSLAIFCLKSVIHMLRELKLVFMREWMECDLVQSGQKTETSLLQMQFQFRQSAAALWESIPTPSLQVVLASLPHWHNLQQQAQCRSLLHSPSVLL